MSYQVLARKWRPKTFEQLVGQEHVVTVLVNAIAQQRLHHAYLFTGTRGVGKTTIARIFAKSLNCQQGVTAQPCGKCDVCLDIDQGRFIDLLEIDAASRTKVDDTREILDNVQYAPTRGRYKVYLIDEVHMLSRSSFNALLKTLEEPPEHVKFILATTDPQKLPITVLSRCLQFHLKALTVYQIEQKLDEILQAESVTVDKGALTLLAKAAKGSMRDSLSLTDQAIAQGQGTISLVNLRQMLGGVDQNWPYKILISLLKQDAQELMNLAREIASYAPSYSRLYAELIQLLHQVALYQMVEQHFDLPKEQSELIEKFSQAMTAEDIQLYYQIALNGRKDLPYAGDEQAAFDMTLLRLLAFKPMQQVTSPKIENQQEVTLVDFDEIDLSATEINISTPLNDPHTPSEAEDKETHTEQQLAQEMQAIEQTAQEQFVSTEVDTVTELTEPIHTVKTEQPNNDNDIPAEVESTSLQQENVIDTDLSSSIEKVLATRNMLRSRKKKLEKTEKKPNDAIQRQPTQVTKSVSSANVADVPAIDTLPDEPFTPEVIDPAVIRKANQVDKWANMIDAMALNGRLRQLALQATISEKSGDDLLVLALNQSTKHLKTDVAHQQLQDFVSSYFNKPMTVEIEIVEHTIDDPLQIQGKINEKRYEYAKEVLLNDTLVKSLQDCFQATIDEKTIVAR